MVSDDKTVTNAKPAAASASTGATASAAASSAKPTLASADLSMPGMDVAPKPFDLPQISQQDLPQASLDSMPTISLEKIETPDLASAPPADAKKDSMVQSILANIKKQQGTQKAPEEKESAKPAKKKEADAPAAATKTSGNDLLAETKSYPIKKENPAAE